MKKLPILISLLAGLWLCGCIDGTEEGGACSANSECRSNLCHAGICGAKLPDTTKLNASHANINYCHAVTNVCKLDDTYRVFEGCVESMEAMRNLAPKCTKEWDDAYICMAAQDCYTIDVYDDPLPNLYYNEVNISGAPDNCEPLIAVYLYCATH